MYEVGLQISVYVIVNGSDGEQSRYSYRFVTPIDNSLWGCDTKKFESRLYPSVVLSPVGFHLFTDSAR